MVAVTSGLGLGLFGSSASDLGGAGLGGPAALGRGRERVYVNTATGNLVIQSQDERLSALGLDLALVRTYNSQGLLDDDNGDNWRLGIHQRVHGLTGSLNGANSTIAKVFGDGREVVYRYDTSLNLYVSTAGDGAHDTLSNSSGTWTWTDGSGRNTETYDNNGRLIASRDADGNTIGYGYNGSLLTEIVDASGQTTYLDYSGNNLTQIRVVSNGQTQTLTRYAYDSSNRLIQVSVDLSPADNAVNDGHVFTTTYAYDGSSKRIASIAQSDGSSVAFTYELVNGTYRIQSYEEGAPASSVPANTSVLQDTETVTTVTDYALNQQLTNAPGWLPPTALDTPAAGNLNRSRLASNANGDALAVWSEGSSIWARFYRRASDSWGPMIALRTAGTQNLAGDATQVALDDAGNAIVAYTYQDQPTGFHHTMYARSFSAATQTWSAETVIGSGSDVHTGFANYIRPYSISLENGIGAISWVTKNTSTGTPGSVYVARFNNGTFVPGQLVETQNFVVNHPSVRVASNGDIMVVWTSDAATGNGLYVNRFRASTGTWSGAQLLTAGAATLTELEFDNAGNAYIVWRAATTTPAATNVMFRRFNASTNAWEPMQILAQWANTNITYFPPLELVVDGAGNALVAYADMSTLQIKTRQRDAATGVWGPAKTLPGSSAYTEEYFDEPLTAMMNNGHFAVIYQNGNTGLWLISRQENGVWTQVAPFVTGTTTQSIDVHAALDDRGNMVAVWTTGANGYVSRYSVDRTYLVPANATWESVAQALYGSAAAAQTLRNMMGNPPLVAGTVLRNPPLNFSVTTTTTYSVAPYYTVLPGDTWETIAQAVYGTNAAGAVNALRSALDNISLLAGQHLTMPLSLAYFGSGRRTTFTHSQAEGRTDVQDALGYVTSYIRDAQGRLSRVLSPALGGGARLDTRYGYDADGNLTSITEDPDGLNRVVTMGYDSRGNMLSKHDDLGNTITRTYDANNQLLTESRIAGQTARYVYDAESHLRFEISADGRVTEHQYNAIGERTTTLAYVGALHTASAYTEGDLAAWAGARDKSQLERTDYTYDFRGNVSTATTWSHTTTGGVGTGTQSTTHFVYDRRGLLLQTIEPRGNDYVTSYTYDGMGRVLTTTEWLATGVTRTSINDYDDAARSVTTTLANGLVTTQTYNLSGELVSITNDLGLTQGTTSYAYDAAGRLIYVTDPNGVRQFNIYDAADRRVAQIDGDGSLTEFIYDRTGAVIKTIGYATRISDATRATLASTNTVTLDTLRTEAGTSPNADRIARQVYNAAGQLVYSIDQIGAVTEYRYDGAGRVTDTLQRRNLVTIARSVDQVLPGDLSIADHADDRRTRTFYDSDGHVIGLLDAEGWLTEYVYDAAGRRTRDISYANTPAASVRATGSFADLKQSAGLDDEATPQDPERDEITYYFYDGQGRQIGILDAEGYLTETVFDVAGNVAERIRYDDPLTYTAGATVDSLRNDIGADVIRERTVYSRDGAGQVTSETTTRGTATAGASATTSYTYDLIGNQISETRSDRAIEKRYDRLGRVVAELSAEGRALITAGMSEEDIGNIWSRYGVAYAYDLGGRRMSATQRPDDTQTNVTLYFYDADNRLRFVVNPRGERTEYRYDAFGQLRNEMRYATRIDTSGLTGGLLTSQLETALTASADPTSDSLKTYEYTLTGNISSERIANTSSTDEDGLTTYSYNVFGENDVKIEGIDATRTLRTDFTFDKRGRLTQTRWDDVAGGFNKTETRTYDTFGRLRTLTDARLATRSYEYDRLGRVLVNVDVESTDRTVTTYDAFSRTLTVRDALNNLTRYEYDDVNRRTKLITPEGIEVVTQFTVHGQTQWVTSAGNTTTYEYDANGQVRTISDSVGPLESRTYDRSGRQVTQTNARGILTRLTYDAAGRVLTRTVDAGPDGTPLVTTYVYDGQGLLQDVTEPNGRLTRTTYDRSGRVTLVAIDPNGLNIRTQYAYDRTGSIIRVTEGEGSARPSVKEFRYDSLGRRTHETIDPGSGTNPATGQLYLNLTTEYRYDLNGNVTRKIDARGHSAWYVYDAHNRVTHTVDALGGVTSMTYDEVDNVRATRRHAVSLPPAVLANNDRPTAADVAIGVSAEDKVSRSFYDRDGREKYVIDSFGAVTERLFDADGNVIRERIISSPLLTGTYNTTAEVTTALGSAASTISANDRGKWTTYDLRSQAVFTVDGSGAVTQTKYDAVGNVTSVTQFATLRSTTASTDLASMQAWADGNANDALNRTTRFFYDASNRLRFKVDGEGFLIETQYDTARRSEVQITFVNKPAVTAATTFIEMVVVADFVRTSLDQTTTTLFDAAGRVSRITDSVGNYKEYTYDAQGNVLTFRNEKGAVWNYAYDANGRLKEEVSPSVSVTLVSDSGSGLASSTSAARIVTQYDYDKLGNLTTKIEGIRRFADNAISSVGARTTIYSYDALGRQTGTRFPPVDIYVGAYTDLSGSTPLQQADLESETIYDALGNATRNRDVAGSYSYKVHDALGRVRYEIDALGYVTERTYDAFGNELTTTRFAQALGALPAFTDNRIQLSAMDSAVAALRSNGANRTIVKTYDRINRVSSVSQPPVLAFEPNAGAPDGHAFTAAPTTHYEYNAAGQVIREWRLIDTLGNGIANPATSPTTNSWATTHYYYDRRGYRTAEVDAMRFLTMYEFDETGDLTRQREFAIPVVSFDPTSATAPTPPASSIPGGALTDYGLDRERVYVYDRLNRLTRESLLNVEYGAYMGQVIETRVGTRQKEYRYDAVGNQVYSIEGNDIRHTYYDALGRVVASTEGLRNRGNDTWVNPITEMRRDAFGNLVEEIGYANGAATTSLTEYTLEQTNPSLERHTLLKIDSHGRVVKSQDAIGAVRHAAYNARGDLVKEWQDVTNRALTDLGSTPTTSVIETLVTMYEYDVLGRRTATHEAETASVVVRTRAQYNSFGEITYKSVDGGWAGEYFDYDNGGRLWRSNSGDGVDKVYLYNLAGQSTVDIRSRSLDLANATYTAETVNGFANTMRTESRYDLLGRLIEKRLPRFNASGSLATPTTQQTFDRWGNVVAVTSEDGGLTTYRYNQQNQLTLTLLPLATVLDTRFSIEQRTERSQQRNTYDLYGRLMQVIDANGGYSRALYNFAGQMIEQINADNTTQGLYGSRKKFTYDAFGNQIQVTDELGYQSRFIYDGANNLVQVAREIVLDGFASTSPTDTSATSNPRVLWEYYGYDQAGRRISETNGEGEVTKYWYDLRGNLIRRRTPRNFDTTYEYDAFSRKTRETDANGSYSTWTYDAFGRTTAHRELTNDTSPNLLFRGEGATHQYAYDEAGLLTLQTNSWGLRRELYYDTAGHLTSLIDNGVATWDSGLASTDRISTYEYDAAGRKRRETVMVDGRVHQDTTIGYDARGRISTLNDLDYQLTYSYDGNGNRTLIQSTYRDHQLNQHTQELYYRYDAMNRVTISQGYRTSDTVPDIAINSSQGIKLTYNARGERINIRTAGTRFAIVDYLTNGVFQYRTVNHITPTDGMGSEHYQYDGLGRMTVLGREADKLVYETTTGDYVDGEWSSEPISVRTYDKASRLLTDTNYILEGSSLVPRVTTTYYDDDGRTEVQVTSKSGQLESVVRFGDAIEGNWYRGYDAASVLRGYSVEVYQNGSYRYTSTYQNFYRLGEGYLENFQSVSSSGSGAPQAGSTTRTYNVNNELVQFTDSRDAARTRYFANNAAGQALTVIQGQFDGASGRMNLGQAWDAAVNRSTWGGTYNQPKAQYFFFADDNYVGSFGQLQSASNAFVANFDVNYTPISDEYPGSMPSQVIVQAGETLRTIAARVFGDANLWYLIAEANGLNDPSAVLQEGVALEIPSDVVPLSNAAGVFKPYEPSKALGDTTPTQPAPPAPKKKKGCGVFGKILVIVVAVVVTYFTAGAATGVIGGVLGSGATATAVATTAGAVIGAAAGSIVSQGVAIAIGEQESFSWKSVAAAALAAGLAPGASSLGGLTGSQVISAAINSAVNQGVNIALGLQEKFNWKAVAAAAVAAPVAGRLGEKAGSVAGKALRSDFAGNVVGNFTSGLTNQMAYAAFAGGKINYTQLAVDSFGNALGNSIVSELTTPPQLRGLSKEQRARVMNLANRIGADINDPDALNVLIRAGETYSDKYLSRDEVSSRTADYLRLGGASDMQIDEVLDLYSRNKIFEPRGVVSVEQIVEGGSAAVEPQAPRQVAFGSAYVDDALVGAGTIFDTVGKTIEASPVAKYALIGLDVAAGPVAYAVRDTLDKTFIGDARRAMEDRVSDYASDKLAATGRSQQQADFGGAGALGLLSLVGAGAAAALVKTAKVLRASAQKRAAQEARQKAMEQYRATIDDEFYKVSDPALTERMRRAKELQYDKDIKGDRELQGLGGVRIEEKIGRRIEQARYGGDFHDPAPGGYGEIQLKGPIPPDKGSVPGFAASVVKDATQRKTASDTLFVDMTGLSREQKIDLRKEIDKGLAAKQSVTPKPIIYLGE